MLPERAIKIRDKAREFVKKEVPRQLIIDMDTEKIQYPREFVQKAAQHKLLGLRFPEKWGGGGLDWVAETAVIEEIGALSMALSCLYVLPSICGEAINMFGNDYQKEKYLKPVLQGKKFTAEALTEPRGGSDFFGATTIAKKEGSQYILNGQKRFVVGAEGADFFLLYAKTNLSAPPHKSISLFLVDKNMGVETKYLYGLLGTRGGGAGRLVLKDVQVPEENLILGEGRGGEIFYQMMIPERLTSASGPQGMSRAAIEIATKYVHKRKAFGKAIKEFEAVSFKIADSIMLLDACRATVYQVAKAIDSGQPGALCRRLVSEAKRFTTESATTILNNCMQVLGGIGYTNVFPIERLVRDIRLSTIWTGTSEIMNLIIQHEFFKEVMEKEKDSVYRDVEQDATESNAHDEKIYE
jgi:acyl-CoA dehydrogenase